MARDARTRDVLSRGLAAHAARLHVVLERRLTVRLAEHGMTRAEFDVLAALPGPGPNASVGLRPKELSSRLLLTSGGLSNVLRRLEESGYIARTASSADGRGQSVHLTLAGARAIEAADAAVNDAIRVALAPVPRDTLSAGMQALHAALEALSEDDPVHRPSPGRVSPA